MHKENKVSNNYINEQKKNNKKIPYIQRPILNTKKLESALKLR